MKKIIIVGGVAGGATAAARIRRLDEDAEIIMFERGEHISFANCGLPYYAGGTITERKALLLMDPEAFGARYRVKARVCSEVTSISRSSKTVTVINRVTGETYTENYDILLLSPGSVPVRPRIEGLDSGRVFTVRNVADADSIKEFIRENKPGSAAVIGGGFIGIEMAENLKDAGLEVSIVELADQVIAPLDADMACDVQHYIRRQGVKVYLRNGVRRVGEDEDGLNIELDNGSLKADMLVLAIGVSPDVRLAADAGLKTGERGGIVVDENMRTSDPDIFAVGDAIETADFVTGLTAMIPLAGPANKQARIAADNICGIPSVYSGTQGSMVIKVFDMTVAATGINEKTAKRLGLDYDKVFLWLLGHAGYYPGTKFMSLKVVFEKGSGRILGAQAAGFDGVDKRIDVLATAIRAGMTGYDLARLELCYAPPYSSAKDPVNMAGYMIENILSGKLKNFHWHDVENLPRDGSAILIDVREPQEYGRGHIDGFSNIPLHSLRERVSGLDKSKPVYVNCHSGMRSYIACRMLSQYGFDAYNLSGGYRLYSAAHASERA